MLVIYGLGNNSVEYLETRHNAGRIILDDLVQSEGLDWSRLDLVEYAKCSVGEENVWLVRSLGYMNNSGQALQNLLNFFKINLDLQENKLLVIQDDSDQAFGNVKLSIGGGSAGHKGIDDIYKVLDSNRVLRLKIGIRPLENKLRSETFVLSRFSKNELNGLKKLSQDILTEVNLKLLINNRLDRLQTVVNSYQISF